MIGLLSVALILISLFVPESPVFLLENSRYQELEDCLYKMGRFNGNYDPIFSKYALLKLQQSKLKDNSNPEDTEDNKSK